jgi:hypothetical protein
MTPEHYTKNTLECTSWCAKCQDYTQHRVDGGRRGPCMNVHPVSKSRLEKEAKKAAAKKQERLF